MFDDRVRCYDFGKYRLDVTNNELLRDNEPVAITQKSFEVLLYLIENRGRVLKKEELLDVLWDEDFVEESTLTQHIYMLRKALRQNDRDEIFIETLPKIGYRFTADVREIVLRQPLKKEISNPSFPDSKQIQSDSISSEIARFKSLTESGKISAFVREKKRAGKQKTVSTRFLVGTVATAVSAVLFAGLLALIVFWLNAQNSVDQADPGKIEKIAVLPFNQIDGGKDKKLGLGLADALILRLGSLDEISVLPTSAIIGLAERNDIDLLEIGKQLDVDAVLAGTIQHDEDQFRINVQLYSVKKGRPVFSDKFDVTEKNIFAIQDRISELVARKLSVKINARSATLPFSEFTNNQAAYQYYSMGLFHWNSREPKHLARAIEYFGRAVREDPQFVHAYAYLADSYVLLDYYEPPEMSFSSPRSISPNLRKGRQMADLALEIDPECSPALTALATIHIFEGREKEGVALFQRAIENDPQNTTARVRLAWNYLYQGKLEKAVAEMRHAQMLDPLSKTTNLSLAQILNLAGRPDESLIYTFRVREVDETSLPAIREIADSYEQKKMFREAIAEHKRILRANSEDYRSILALGRLRALTGDREEAEKLLQKVLGKRQYDGEIAYRAALTYLSLGDRQQALNWLGRSRSHRGYYPYLLHDYRLDPLRGSPEFEELIKKPGSVKDS